MWLSFEFGEVHLLSPKHANSCTALSRFSLLLNVSYVFMMCVCRLRSSVVSLQDPPQPSAVPAGSWSTVTFCCQSSVLPAHISRVFWLTEAEAFAEKTHQMCLRSAGLCGSMGAQHAGRDTNSVLPFQRWASSLQFFAWIDSYPEVLPRQFAVSAAFCGPEGALRVGAESARLPLPRVVDWKHHL